MIPVITTIVDSDTWSAGWPCLYGCGVLCVCGAAKSLSLFWAPDLHIALNQASWKVRHNVKIDFCHLLLGCLQCSGLADPDSVAEPKLLYFGSRSGFRPNTVHIMYIVLYSIWLSSIGKLLLTYLLTISPIILAPAPAPFPAPAPALCKLPLKNIKYSTEVKP